jgi:hypothetical protein
MSIQEGAEAPTMRGVLFEAFRKRERGGVLTNASIGFLIVSIAIFALFAFAFWRPVIEVVAWYGTIFRELPNVSESEPPPDAFLNPPAALFALIPGYLGLTFVICVSIAAYEAACLRWMIHGESSGPFFGLSLGADTWRVYLGYWIWFACYMGSIYGLQIGGILIGIFAGMIGGAIGGSSAGVVIGGLVAGCFVIVGLCLVIWAAVRMAPAAATSIAKRRFAFFEAWGMSRGRFWPMFGAFAAAFVLYVIIVLAVEMAMVGLVVGRLPKPLPSDWQAYASVLSQPATWGPLAALYVLILAVALIFYLTLFGINARVVKVAHAAPASSVG